MMKNPPKQKLTAEAALQAFRAGTIGKMSLKTLRECHTALANHPLTGSVGANTQISMAVAAISQEIGKKESRHFNWMILSFTFIGAVAASIAAVYAVLRGTH